MKINKTQILNILENDKVASDDVGVYTINFDKLVDKLLLSNDEKKFIKETYKNKHLHNEREHLNEVANLLDQKIELFSDDFWELFLFRKQSYSSIYSQKKWYEMHESYEFKTVKKRVNSLKNLNITLVELEKFLKKINYQQDGYVDLWFSLKKKNKDTFLDEDMKKIILKYGDVDKDEEKKAIMLSYFKQIKELEELYEKNKGSGFRRNIEKELSKYKTIEEEKINLFENSSCRIVYRKDIILNQNNLIYKLNQNWKKIEKIIKVINDFLNIEIHQLKKKHSDEKYIYTIESYSEENLKEKEKLIIKSFTYLPELLLKKEYEEIFKENSYINQEMKDFFEQYIESAELHNNLSEQMSRKNDKKQKNKI